MKKTMLCMLLTLLLLPSVVGCESKQATQSSASIPKNDYTLDMAIANGDYVDIHGITIYNDDVMDAFLEKVAAQESASIRIVRYTIEGDPILTDVVYDGSVFAVTEDSTRDNFGAFGVGTNYYTTLETVYIPSSDTTEYRLVDPAEASQALPQDYELLKSDSGDTTKSFTSPDSTQSSTADSAMTDSVVP